MSESIDINECEAGMSQLEVCDDTDHNQTDDDYDSDEEVEDFDQLYDYIDETRRNSTERVNSDYTKQYPKIYSPEIYEFMNWVFYTNDLKLLQNSNKSESSQAFYTALDQFYKLPENESHDKHVETKMLDNSARLSLLRASNNALLDNIKHLNLLYRHTGTTKQSDERNRNCGLFANAHTIDELKCDIQLLCDTSDEYKIIHRYVTNAGQNYFVKHIFRIERQTEEQSFKQFVDCKRMLLFHGTPIYNCYGILMNGLNTGLHDGIYFADMPQKSYAYTQKFNSHFSGKCYDYVILFVCDVAVGNLDGTGLPQGFSCNLYNGNQSRDLSDVTTIDTAVVPYGKSITLENPIPVGNELAIFFRTNSTKHAYNEYLAARPEQVKLKYLVVFQRSEISLI